MGAMKDQLIVLKNFGGSTALSAEATPIRAQALAIAAGVCAVKCEADLMLATDAMGTLKKIIKAVEGQRKVITRPIDDLKKAAIKLEQDYLSPLQKEHDRITGMANHFLLAQREAERLAAEEAAKAAAQAPTATDLITLKLELAGLRSKADEAGHDGDFDSQQELTIQAEALEDRIETAELAMETVELSAALAPAHVAVSGLTVREKIDFQVEDPFKFLSAFPQFWKSNDEGETLKVMRREFCDALAIAGSQLFTYCEKTHLPIVPGCRVFNSVRAHTR
jgi:hypothetical protein